MSRVWSKPWNMWTPSELASNFAKLGGIVWRVVEHQYTTSTRKIVDTQAEQALLENILEEQKPAYPKLAVHLHYLLKTPFRYYPVNPYGSRFRRAHAGEGVFYASEHIRTALAEFAYYRLRFFAASPQTPLPRNEARLTAFNVKHETSHGLDLTVPPLNRDRSQWTARDDYRATQTFAEVARQTHAEVIRYESVRDNAPGINIALLTPAALVSTKPITQQTWLLYLAKTEVSCTRVADPEAVKTRTAKSFAFPVNQ